MKIPIPPPTHQFLDASGRMTEEWYRVFTRLSNSPSPVDTVSVGFTSTSTDSVAIGEIPAGAIHTNTYVRVNTTFNTLLTVGTSADADAFVTTADLNVNTTGLTVSDRAAGEPYTAPTKVYAAFTASGSTADVDIALVYLTEN